MFKSTKSNVRGRSIVRTIVIALAVALVIINFLLFGNFGKTIPEDRAAAMVLIQKLGQSFSADCKLDSSGAPTSCDGLATRLEQIKGDNEEFLTTDVGELIGVNYLNRVVVVLKPSKRPGGQIYLSCSVWPKKASPLECDVKPEH